MHLKMISINQMLLVYIILHKLNSNHLFLNPYLRMRVYSAAQVFSNRVACALTVQGKPGTEETALFIKHMNGFFGHMNAEFLLNLNLKAFIIHPMTSS